MKCPDEVIPTKLARYLNTKFILNGALACQFLNQQTALWMKIFVISLFLLFLFSFFSWTHYFAHVLKWKVGKHTLGGCFSYLPKLPNPRKYPTTSLPARGGWHHSVFVLVVLPSNRSTFSVAQLRVFTDELNVSLGIFGVRQQVNGINVGNSVRCCEIFCLGGRLNISRCKSHWDQGAFVLSRSLTLTNLCIKVGTSRTVERIRGVVKSWYGCYGITQHISVFGQRVYQP